MTYVIRPAGPGDLPAVLELRAEAERWLRGRGIRQWTPDYDDYARSVLTGWVSSGAAWVVEHDGEVVATISANSEPDPDFWGWASRRNQANALYLGKMIVRRDHAGRGIGDSILNWASARAARAGVRWVRIDVRRDNTALQRHYLSRGFRHVRTWHAPGRRTESGWLAQRPAGSATPTPVTLVERDSVSTAPATSAMGDGDA